MKYLYAALIFMVLFIFPLATWMFLQKGETYLIEVVDELRVVKDSLTDYPFLYTHDGKKDSISRVSFEDLVTVFILEDDYISLKDNLILLDRQFEKANALQFVILYLGTNPEIQLDYDYNNPFLYYKDLNRFNQLIRPNKMAVVDVKGYLRSFYTEKREDFILLVKHLGLLLPEVERGK